MQKYETINVARSANTAKHLLGDLLDTHLLPKEYDLRSGHAVREVRLNSPENRSYPDFFHRCRTGEVESLNLEVPNNLENAGKAEWRAAAETGSERPHSCDNTGPSR